MQGAHWAVTAAAVGAHYLCCCCFPTQVWLQAGGDPAPAGVGADRGALSRAVSTEHAPQQWLDRRARVAPGGECCCCFQLPALCPSSLGCCTKHLTGCRWRSALTAWLSLKASCQPFPSTTTRPGRSASPAWWWTAAQCGRWVLLRLHAAALYSSELITCTVATAASLSVTCTGHTPHLVCVCMPLCADPQEHTLGCRTSSRSCGCAGSTSATQQHISTKAARVHRPGGWVALQPVLRGV